MYNFLLFSLMAAPSEKNMQERAHTAHVLTEMVSVLKKDATSDKNQCLNFEQGDMLLPMRLLRESLLKT